MGLGGTAKKLQKVASLAEDSYKRMNELREQLTQLRTEVQSTSEQVDRMEYDLAEQRALLEALAAEEGIDVDGVIADANIEKVDPEADEEPTGSDETGAAGSAADEPTDSK